MGFWAAVPAIAGVVTAALQARKQAQATKAKNEQVQTRSQLSDNISTVAPLVMAVGQNIHAGINARKARKYNSPANQIKRLRQAGLPTAAGSNITGGQMQVTPVSSYGGEQLNDNLGKSITRHIDKKRLDIAGEEFRSAKANADIKTGEAKWAADHKENFLGSINTNQATMLDFQRSVAESEEILKSNEQLISGIEREVKETLRDKGYLTKEVIAKVDQVLAQTGLINQQFNTIEDQRLARETILNLLKANGMNVFEAFAYMLLTKYMGGGQ